MTEGDLWQSVVGTIHIEKEQMTMEQSIESLMPITKVSYWCGMESTPKHRKGGNISEGFFIGSNQNTCKRCHENRSKSKARAEAEILPLQNVEMKE